MEDTISRPARQALGDTGRQCTATNRSGQRCGRAPIPGGFVCVNHGGKIPIVQKTARERLLAMVDPALDVLLRMLRQAPSCPTCGRSDADRDPTVLRAAQLVLDRTGFHPTLTVQATGATAGMTAEWARLIPADRMAQIATWIAEAKATAARALPAADDAIDMETVHVDADQARDTWRTPRPRRGRTPAFPGIPEPPMREG